MADRLKNKVVIITGASRGIGAKSAEIFAQEGAAVAVWDVREKRGHTVVNGIIENNGRALFCRCDVTNSDQIQQALDQTISNLGTPNVLFNNAGVIRLSDDISKLEEKISLFTKKLKNQTK